MSPCDSEKSEIQPNLHQVGNADHLLSTVVLCYCPTWPMAHVVLLLLAQCLWSVALNWCCRVGVYRTHGSTTLICFVVPG